MRAWTIHNPDGTTAGPFEAARCNHVGDSFEFIDSEGSVIALEPHQTGARLTSEGSPPADPHQDGAQ